MLDMTLEDAEFQATIPATDLARARATKTE